MNTRRHMEIQRNAAIIRWLKRLWHGEPIQDWALDAVVPAIHCRRTRRRLAGLPADGGGRREGR